MRNNIAENIRRFLYPDGFKCVVCGAEIPLSRYGLCKNCKLNLNANYCVRCGRHKAGIGDYCLECGNQSLNFDEARSSVIYDSTAKQLVHRLKFGRAAYLSRTFAEYMLDTLFETDWEFDCFTFVPMFAKRERKRGYNQGRLIAEALSEKTTTPCIPLLSKIKDTKKQATSNREEREKNLSGAFSPLIKPPAHVVIVDDVMTTGSTLNECARTLKNAGASIVYGLTFASVSERNATDRGGVNIRDFRR